MSKIEWDQTGMKTYESGVDHGVLYTDYAGSFESGVPWNGLTSIDCEDDDREATALYSGDVKADFLIDAGGCSGTINAFTYPEEFEACIGSEEVLPGIFIQQQSHPKFGMSYRTFVGNDTDGQEHAYKLHLIYGAVITSNSTSRSTVNDSPEALEFSWEFETTPQENADYTFSELIFDSRKFTSESLAQLETILYGSDDADARLPTLDELIDLFAVEEPIPAEWDGYPHDRMYPSTTSYPANIGE